MGPYVPAAGAALLFGLSTAVQHRVASGVPIAGVGALRLTLRLVRNPVWLLARAADLMAVALQALALRSGALVAVQSIVSCGIVAAMLTGAVLERRAPRRGEVIGAVLVVLGAVLVGQLTEAADTDISPPVERWIVLAGIVATATVLAAAWRSTARAPLPHPSVVLGAAAGTCLAVGAGLLKLGSLGVDGGGARSAVVVGVGGFVIMTVVGNVFAQRSYQRGALAQGLPALVAAEPVAAFVVGTVLFREHLNGPAPTAAGSVGLGVLIGGVWLLGRTSVRIGDALEHRR